MTHSPLRRPLIIAAALVAGTLTAAVGPALVVATTPSSTPPFPSSPYPTNYPTTPGYPASGPFFVQIEDGDSLGRGDSVPDAVTVYGYNVYPPGYIEAAVVRDGSVIAASSPSTQSVRLSDLHAGDEIVATVRRDGVDRELFRFTYARALHLDAVCAGSSTFTGTRTPGSTNLFGSSAVWVPLGDYPAGTSTYPYYYDDYLGGGPGYVPTQQELAKVSAVGGSGVSFDARQAVPPGMQLFLSESYYLPGAIEVYQRVEQNAVDCTPTPTPLPTATPISSQPSATPAPGATATPVAAPPKDTTAPKLTLAKFDTRLLKKLGIKGLIKHGLPLTLTLSEPGTLGGSITLVDGKRKTKFNVTTPVKAGKQTLHLKFSKAVEKKLLGASKKAKLKLALTATDQAGNTTKLPARTVKLP